MIYGGDVKAKSGLDKEAGNVKVIIGRARRMYTRKYVKIQTTEHMHQQGRKMKTAAMLWKLTPETVKDDFKRYAKLYDSTYVEKDDPYTNKAFTNGYSHWCAAILKHDSEIGTIGQLVILYGNSLEEWITNGIIKNVPHHIPFDALIRQ